jgi:hypothetical protein
MHNASKGRLASIFSYGKVNIFYPIQAARASPWAASIAPASSPQ